MVSDASTYELLPHLGYQNPYNLMHNSSSNLKFKNNSLRNRVNSFKYEALRLRPKYS